MESETNVKNASEHPWSKHHAGGMEAGAARC